MKTLFRNIRQNLINEGKTSKYIKYAIGEIVLVVIGILIALQINNWNEQKNEQKNATILAQSMLDDIVKDTKLLNDSTISLKKSGIIILGSGIVKHSILNANMLRSPYTFLPYTLSS